MKSAKRIHVQMTPAEVALLIRTAFDADDIERAFIWAQLLLGLNDPIDVANDLVTFRSLIRTDGRVVDTTAVKSLVASAT